MHFASPPPRPAHRKAINKAYEEYVLTVGNLDERVFLGEDAEEEMGALSRSLGAGPGTEPAERVPMKTILQQHLDKVSGAQARGRHTLRSWSVLTIVCAFCLLPL